MFGPSYRSYTLPKFKDRKIYGFSLFNAVKFICVKFEFEAQETTEMNFRNLFP
jgi:hypothetical protein